MPAACPSNVRCTSCCQNISSCNTDFIIQAGSSCLWWWLIMVCSFKALKWYILQINCVPSNQFSTYRVNTLRLRQDGRHFPDDIFKCIFLNENVLISIKISLKFVPKGPINKIPALAQIMAWRRPGGKPLSEPMMVSLLMHICVTRPQWVKWKNEDYIMCTCSTALQKWLNVC